VEFELIGLSLLPPGEGGAKRRMRERLSVRRKSIPSSACGDISSGDVVSRREKEDIRSSNFTVPDQ